MPRIDRERGVKEKPRDAVGQSVRIGNSSEFLDENFLLFLG